MNSTILVDGVERPRLNSQDRPIHPSEEGVTNFWRWFGDSRCVDAHGRPLVLYHGSTVWERPDGRQLGDVRVFDRMASTRIVGRAPSIDQVGVWFSTAPCDTAGAGMYAQGGAIYPVYLRIENMKPTTFVGLSRVAHRLAHGDDGLEPGSLGRPQDVEPCREWLMEAGYDGLRIEHDPQREGVSTEFRDQVCFVALSSAQIKSAIGNSGRFNPANESIDDRSEMPNPSVATEREIATYTEGQCHEFAIALHREFGWPIAISIVPDEPFWEGDDGDSIASLVHAFAVDPNGMAWDVRGAISMELLRESADAYLDVCMECHLEEGLDEADLQMYVEGSGRNDQAMGIERPLAAYADEGIDRALEVAKRVLSGCPGFPSLKRRPAAAAMNM